MTDQSATNVDKPMYGTVGLRQKGILVFLGVYPEEKGKSRPVNISVECTFDWRQVEGSDNLELVPDYTRIAGLIEKQANIHVELIEHWVARLAAAVLAMYPIVTRIRLTLEKSDPSGLPEGSVAWAELEVNR